MREKNIIKASLYVTIFVVLIKILGFVKQLVVASYYGSSIDTDIYFLAYGFENTITQIVFSQLQVGALKIYIEEKQKNGKVVGGKFLFHTILTFVPIGIGIAILINLFSYPIAKAIAPTYSIGELRQLEDSLKLFSLVTVFSPIITLSTTALNANRNYVKAHLPTFIAVVSEIFMIALFANKYGISARNWAFIFSTILSTICVGLLAARYMSFGRIYEFDYGGKLKQLMVLSFPLMIGNGMTLILTMLDRTIGSTLSEGSVSALNYSSSIYSILISIVSTGLVTIVTTFFTECVVNNDYKKLSEKLTQISRLVSTLIVPVCIIVFCLAEDLIGIVFGRGVFTSEAIIQTAQATRGYIIATIFVINKDLYIRAHYALGETKSPLKNNMISGIVNIPVSIILMKFIGVGGITLGTAIAEVIGLILSIVSYRKLIQNKHEFSVRLYLKSFKKMILSSIFAGIATYVTYFGLISSNLGNRIIIVCVVTIVAYFVMLYIQKSEETSFLRRWQIR